MKTLRLILGDQLNYNHSWYKVNNPSITYVMMEVRQETDYVKHHIQKVATFFSAMRSFHQFLIEGGHRVEYFKINDKTNTQAIPENLRILIKDLDIQKFEYQLPDEYRLDKQLTAFCESLSIDYEVFESEHFLTGRNAITEFFKGKKQYLMESFYRHMRRDHHILMSGKEPLGGQWNFDASNRNTWDNKIQVPEDAFFTNDATDIYHEIKSSGAKTFGNIEPKQLIWPINREQALHSLESFCKNRLKYFGTYQDALSVGQPFLFHSRISFALNSKMLHPMEVVNRVVEEWRSRQDEIELNQVEGFIRQIIGWREYMRGIYWAKMPDYASLNFFDHQRKLPEYFWTGDTKMNCIKTAVTNSLDHSYAHHIQRLMVTGNFALLAGISPDELDQWYLGIYIDAIEWVEITNTRGMSQFADGGIVGTKPYVSSSNYIKKMGDYCDVCHYAYTKKTGEYACPFNSLYWHFYARNREKLEKNPRIGMMYRTWDKMKSENKAALLNQAEAYLDNLDKL